MGAKGEELPVHQKGDPKAALVVNMRLLRCSYNTQKRTTKYTHEIAVNTIIMGKATLVYCMKVMG